MSEKLTLPWIAFWGVVGWKSIAVHSLRLLAPQMRCQRLARVDLSAANQWGKRPYRLHPDHRPRARVCRANARGTSSPSTASTTGALARAAYSASAFTVAGPMM